MTRERPAAEKPADETPAQRRARLAAVFGDVLPDTTADERDPEDSGGGAVGGGSVESASDAWLRAQVPPHHGGE